MITTLYLIRCTRQLYTVSDILSILWSWYPQQYCHFLCLFVYCPDKEYERILDGDLCLLGVMETWADDNMHMHLIKVVKKFKVSLNVHSFGTQYPLPKPSNTGTCWSKTFPGLPTQRCHYYHWPSLWKDPLCEKCHCSLCWLLRWTQFICTC